MDVKAVTMHLFQVSQMEGGWEAMVVLDILQTHVLEHRGFAHAGFPKHVHMPVAVHFLESYGNSFVAPDILT